MKFSMLNTKASSLSSGGWRVVRSIFFFAFFSHSSSGFEACFPAVCTETTVVVPACDGSISYAPLSRVRVH